jgi:hypothetical protein
LQPIRILIFIDQNIAKTMGDRLSHRFMRGQQFSELHQQIVIIQQLSYSLVGFVGSP